MVLTLDAPDAAAFACTELLTQGIDGRAQYRFVYTREFMGHHIVRRIIWFCIAAVLLYAIFVIWTDARRNLAVLRAFPWGSLPAILGLVMVNFILREVKWNYFRKAAGIQVPRGGSFLVFFSGYSMSISPGRVGELIKPFMYKEYFGQKMRRGIPLVFCERLSDLLGMILLALITIGFYIHGVAGAHGQTEPTSTAVLVYSFLVFSAGAMAVVIAMMRNKRLVYGMLGRLHGVKKAGKSVHKLRHLYHATYPLLTVKNLGTTTLLAAVSWSFECMAMLKILHGVGATGLGLGETMFVFCMATIIGGFLFFLPGGLGGFEGAMYKLLAVLGTATNAIVPAILLTRFCTLFFAVGLGFLAILLTSMRYHKKLAWEAFEHVEEQAES